MRNEKKVVTRRERDRDEGMMEHKEIAKRLGLSRSVVRRIEMIALAKLAVMLGDEGAFDRLPQWVKDAGTPRMKRPFP